jgi:hypothetical protein
MVFGRLVVLGDMSASMSYGNRTSCLERCLAYLLQESTRAGGKVGVGVWSSKVRWLSSVWVQGEEGAQQVLSGLKKMLPDGGNEMRVSIEVSFSTPFYSICMNCGFVTVSLLFL